jgi:general secretion pathway protein I
MAEGRSTVAAGASREHGFTLIEVMVALAVFALAALALIRLESATLRSVAVLDRTFLAQTVARNVAIDTVTQGRTPVLGPSSGVEFEAGRPWRWTQVISGTGDPRIVRIEVSVADASGQQLGRTTMIRPPSLAGQP